MVYKTPIYLSYILRPLLYSPVVQQYAAIQSLLNKSLYLAFTIPYPPSQLSAPAAPTELLKSTKCEINSHLGWHCISLMAFPGRRGFRREKWAFTNRLISLNTVLDGQPATNFPDSNLPSTYMFTPYPLGKLQLYWSYCPSGHAINH